MDFGVRFLYFNSVYVKIGQRRTRKTDLKGRNRTSTGFRLEFGVRLLYFNSVYVTIGLRRTRKTALKGRNRTSTGFIWILENVFYKSEVRKQHNNGPYALSHYWL